MKAFPSLSGKMLAGVLAAVFLALAAVVLWVMRVGRSSPAVKSPEILEVAFLIILMPLFSPLGWNYNYLYSLSAVILILSAWGDFPRAGQTLLAVNFVILSTSLVEVWGREAFHMYTHYALVVVNSLVLLAALAYLRLKHAL